MKKIFILLALICAIVSVPALAGTACSEKTPSANTIQKAFRMALKTRDALDATGAQVAIVGRVGQDLSKYGLRFSHAGIIWRDSPQGKWIFTHELNQCGTASSALFNEGLANFFIDDMFAWDALIIVPSPALQTSLITRLKSNARMLALHEPHYNMVAYPFSSKYQNSNQWVLEVIADAKMEAAQPSRAATQTWLRQQHYQPTVLHIPALQRLGGRMFKANIAFDDHPNEDRFSGNIAVVSVDSLRDFVQQIDVGASTQTFSLTQ